MVISFVLRLEWSRLHFQSVDFNWNSFYFTFVSELGINLPNSGPVFDSAILKYQLSQVDQKTVCFYCVLKLQWSLPLYKKYEIILENCPGFLISWKWGWCFVSRYIVTILEVVHGFISLKSKCINLCNMLQ